MSKLSLNFSAFDVGNAVLNKLGIIHRACAVGNIEHALEIIKNDKDNKLLNLQASEYNITPLNMACRSRKEKIVEMLLDLGADLQLQEKNGFTCLHICAQKGFTELVTILANRNALLNCEAALGITPLMVAAGHGHLETCRTLLEIRSPNEVEVNKEDNTGSNALHLACSYGHQKLSLVLISYGADLQAKDKEGFTPLDIYGNRSPAKGIFSKAFKGVLGRELHDAHRKESAWRRRQSFLTFIKWFQKTHFEKSTEKSTELYGKNGAVKFKAKEQKHVETQKHLPCVDIVFGSMDMCRIIMSYV